MIKAVIFDLDGTLADTVGSLLEAVNMTMEHYSLPLCTEGQVRLALGNGARTLIRRLLPKERRGDEHFITEAVDYYNARYEQTYTHIDGMYEGMAETISALDAAKIKYAVLSNKPDKFVKAICALLLPSAAIAQGQSKLPLKPNPTSLLYIAKRLGVSPSECAMVGDGETDIKAGSAAGMMTVGCSWGYRGESVLRAAGADFIADRPGELINILTK